MRYLLVSSNDETQLLTDLGEANDPVTAYRQAFPIDTEDEQQMFDDTHMTYDDVIKSRFGMNGDNPADFGNYVDGDSSEAQILIEIDWDTHVIKSWPEEQ